jgi:hypothetical protein
MQDKQAVLKKSRHAVLRGAECILPNKMSSWIHRSLDNLEERSMLISTINRRVLCRTERRCQAPGVRSVIRDWFPAAPSRHTTTPDAFLDRWREDTYTQAWRRTAEIRRLTVATALGGR